MSAYYSARKAASFNRRGNRKALDLSKAGIGETLGMLAAISALLALLVLASPLPTRAQQGSHAGSQKGQRKSQIAPGTTTHVFGPHAVNPQIVPCPSYGTEPLLPIPEIKYHGTKLKAVIKLAAETRTIWASVGDNRCATQYLRTLEGYDPSDAKPWPTGPEPLPGPTLRAHVGNTVEVTFLNRIDTQRFAESLDQGEQGFTSGCDQVVATPPPSKPNWQKSKKYVRNTQILPKTNNAGNFYFSAADDGTSGATAPTFPQKEGATVTDGTVVWTNIGTNPPFYPGGDKMPNCLHGSSTANMHYHGTHTTPNTTGDNVLLFVRPSLRVNGGFEPSDKLISTEFAKIWDKCETSGPPTQWNQLPVEWRNDQERLLKLYDKTAPYKGVKGALPPSMQLWPQNQMEINEGLWPQYQIGAYPYCFRLPEYDPAHFKMGQAPGTHWYHAHKHGSTALNVANGMTGILIIEGQYDTDLHKFYGDKLVEQVMMLQQLSSAPFPLLDPTNNGNGPGAPRPPISINGRRNPVVAMRPGEVQLWRIANGAFRDAVQFLSFTKSGQQQPCNQSGPQTVVVPCVHWRQIAQDGVQLDFDNYKTFGKEDRQFNLAPANRGDLLVQAPTEQGTYVLQALANAGTVQDNDTSYTFPLLTVNVTGTQVNPKMEFITNKADFPTFPDFLKDIPQSEIFNHRDLVFGAGNSTIDGAAFDPHKINQAMLLNTSEEWKISNQASDKSHPFHIHINPFQITAVFEPNSQPATTPGDKCYADPLKPGTWDACAAISPPWVWWDTFAIPTTRTDTLVCTQDSGNYSCPSSQGGACSDTQVCTVTYSNQMTRTLACNQNSSNQWVCPNPPGTTAGACSEQQACTLDIPGYFKMRTRFADFAGQYVLHCHILIHEDRGMMQFVSVCPNTTSYSHQ